MDAELIMGEYLAEEIIARRGEAAEEVFTKYDDFVGGRRRRDLVAGGAPLNVGVDDTSRKTLIHNTLVCGAPQKSAPQTK